MSRMGKVPIVPPQGVTVTVSGDEIKVKGPKGQLSCHFVDQVSIRNEDGKFWVDRKSDMKSAKAYQGLTHRLMTNMIHGVTEGFKKELQIVGVGYRAAVEGNELVLALGFSHPVRYAIPEGIKITVDKNTQIFVEGIDKQKVGQVASVIRKFRKPDAYKGKGIRYADEHVKLKPGKAAVGSGF